MTINNATVKNSGGYSSAIRNGGDSQCDKESHLTIKDGNFSGGLNAVKNDECGILTINGGTFSNTSQYVIMNWNKATINNGTFSVKDSADAVLFTAAYRANRAVGELIVNNGTFTGNGSQKMVKTIMIRLILAQQALPAVHSPLMFPRIATQIMLPRRIQTIPTRLSR